MIRDPIGTTKEELAIIKRQRFCKILREGKRICRLEAEEREAVMALCDMIEKRTARMIREGGIWKAR